MKTKKYTAYDYIELVILILLTVGPTPPLLKILLYVAVFLYDVITNRLGFCLPLSKYKLFIPLLIILSMSIAMVIDLRNVSDDNPYSLAGFAYLLPFVFCLFYIKRYEFDSFLVLFERVAFFLCICSLIGFTIQLISPQIILKFPKIIFYGRSVSTILIYGAIPDWTYTGLLKRNCGCAFEPGAFQILMNLGIAALFKNREKIDRKVLVKILLYSLSVVSTLSTSGLVILFLIIVINCFKKPKAFLVMITIGIMFLPLISYVITRQIGKMATGNFDSRFSNTFYVIRNYWYKIFGLGSTGYNAIYSENQEIGSWDLYTNLFLRYGYFFIVLFLIIVIKLRKKSFSFFLVIALSFLTEAVLGPITVLFMYYSLQCNETKAKLEEITMYGGGAVPQ